MRQKMLDQLPFVQSVRNRVCHIYLNKRRGIYKITVSEVAFIQGGIYKLYQVPLSVWHLFGPTHTYTYAHKSTVRKVAYCM